MAPPYQNTMNLTLPGKGQITLETRLGFPTEAHQLLRLQPQHPSPFGDLLARHPNVIVSLLLPGSVAHDSDSDRLLQMMIKKEQENLIQSQLRQNLILQLSQPQPQSLTLALAHHHLKSISDQSRQLNSPAVGLGALKQEASFAIPSLFDFEPKIRQPDSQTVHKARRTSATNEYHEPNTLATLKEKASVKYSSSSAPPGGVATLSSHVSSKSKTKVTKWLQTYDRLKKYRVKYGDCIVPRGYTADSSLASWVAEQRKQYKLFRDGRVSSITPERIQLLQDIDFTWSAQEAAWDRSFTHLTQFKAKIGHCQVPLNHAEFPKLGLWIKEQRRHYSLWKRGRPSHMTEQRATRLNSLGFCWDTHEASWTERYKELAWFKEQTGSCIVTTTDPKFAKLATWVQHQRRQYRKFHQGKASHITKKRIHALENLGFVWYPRKKSQHCESWDNSESDSEEETAKTGPSKRPRFAGK